jgi:hypothetical protein
MPIKYNLTKYDMLAEEFHELAQKRDTTFSKDEETLKAMAVIVASFASAHSWQTYKVIIEGDPNLVLNCPEIKNEYQLAKNERWKRVLPQHIQDVSRMNIKDSLFYTWLSANEHNDTRDIYKSAWGKLKEGFNEECDGISIAQH